MKIGYFRRFILDTYGLEYLKSGAGALDIGNNYILVVFNKTFFFILAGGKGEVI